MISSDKISRRQEGKKAEERREQTPVRQNGRAEKRRRTKRRRVEEVHGAHLPEHISRHIFLPEVLLAPFSPSMSNPFREVLVSVRGIGIAVEECEGIVQVRVILRGSSEINEKEEDTTRAYQLDGDIVNPWHYSIAEPIVW
jgi:hypothetical protein